MKTFRTLIQASTLALLAINAQAEGAMPDYPGHFVSTKTRAEVIAELRAARKAGQVAYGEVLYQHVDTPVASTLTRAQVRAEAIEARRLGLVWFGNAHPRLPTSAELESIRRAGLAAVETQFAAQGR
jgi:hypothetical protein